MTRETISLVEFERYDEGVKATIKRISAENTWLRHNYGELEQRVLQLKKDVAAPHRHKDQIAGYHHQQENQDKEQQTNTSA